MVVNYEKEQVKEQKETNFVLWVNTAFTIISGLASMAIAIIALKHK